MSIDTNFDNVVINESVDLRGTLKVAGTTLGSTATEIDKLCDASAYVETIAAAGALTVAKKAHKLALVGAGAVTLAVPTAAELGMVKVIEMTTDNGDVTLALTNIIGQSAGTTATFDAVGDALVLVGGVAKWIVIGEGAVTLA